MKRNLVLIFLFCANLNPNIQAQSNALQAPNTCDSLQTVAFLNRLEAINEIDKSKLSRNEKKILRKEVKTLKEKLDIVPTGIYISSGALIVIVILLIILL